MDKRTHVFRHQRPSISEQAILRYLGPPTAQLLDVGTAATGRSALIAARAGWDVVSIELNVAAIMEFAAGPNNSDLDLAAADMGNLPFDEASFGVVLVAFHGMDYVLESQTRRDAFREIERVLRPDGVAVIDAYNPVGLLLRREAWRTPALRKRMLSYVCRGQFLRPSVVDLTGLELHQALPRQVIRQVENTTSLRHEATFDGYGRSVTRLSATLRSPEPYFVLRKSAS